MDTRLLYMIALVFVTVVGSFYYFSGKSKNLEANNNQNLNSTAHNIYVIQTSDNGQLYATTKIATMTQWMQQDRAEVKDIQGTLYEKGQPSTTFNADQGIATNQYTNMTLLGHVVVNKLNNGEAPSITFNTDRLEGNTKTNQIHTDRPVLVNSPQAQFTSQGLKANLTTGQYDFFAIRGKYDPSKP